MSLLYQSPDLALPWSSSRQEDKRFNLTALIMLVLVVVVGVLVQRIELKELSKDELTKVPDSVVKFQKREKEKPKPPPPKVEVKKEEPKKEEPKKEKKKPEKKPPPPKTKKEADARKKAEKKLAEVKNELSSLQDAFKPMAANKNLAKGDKAATVNKKQIMGDAKGVKGIGAVAAVSTGSNVGALSERAATEVGGAGLGSTEVSGSGSVAEAAASKPKVDGQRSEEQIRAVLDANKGRLYAIYNRELRKDPTLQGKVTFELTIAANGSVTAAKIISSALGNKALETKLVSRMRLINFGADDVATTKTRWSIDFLPY